MSGGEYVEPFAGRGNVFWLAVHMLDYCTWWLNDPWTARWFDAIQKVNLRDIPSELTEVLARFYRKRAIEDRDNDDVAVAIEERTMFSGGAKNGITLQWQRSPSLSGFIENMKLARSILKTIRPKITDYEWQDCGLERLSDRDFVYIDPPYQNANRNLYHHNSLIHEHLLEYLREAPHLWMLSGYSSSLYLRYLGDPSDTMNHRMFVYQRQHGEDGVYRTECIWTNYTIGADGIARRKRLKKRRIRKRRVGKRKVGR